MGSNALLFKELSVVTSSDVIAKGLASALGVEYGFSLDESKVSVEGFFLRPTETILSIYILTTGKFVLYEVTKEGDMLTIALPISRIRRVTESFVGGRRQLVVEIAADRSTVVLEADGNSMDELGNPIAVTSGIIRASGYELIAENEEENSKLLAFAISLRNAIEGY
jgi:hypothetical protein